MQFVKAWVSQNSGRRYEIYRNDHGVLTCTCPACYHGQQCWEMKKLVGDDQVNEIRRIFQQARQADKPKRWWDECPELQLLIHAPYVYEVWYVQNQINMRRKW